MSLLNTNPIKEVFLIGEEWIYFKIYSGAKSIDLILIQEIAYLINVLRERKLISHWFFVRYKDPHHHLRLRIKITEIHEFQEVVFEVKNQLEPLVYKNIIWRIQLDCYFREIERYGNQTMELSESIFTTTSDYVIKMIDFIETQPLEENINWILSLDLINIFLDMIGFTLEEKRDFIKWPRDNFAKEFNMDRDLKMQLDKKFRINRNEIEAIIVNGSLENVDLTLFHSSVKSEKFQMSKIIGELSMLINLKSKKSFPFISSHIHMIMNKAFRSKNRAYELVCYDFLWRVYASLTARKKCDLRM